MTIRKQQSERRPKPATILTSRKYCTGIKLRGQPSSTKIRSDNIGHNRKTTYRITRSQTKSRRQSSRQSEVSKLTKTTKQTFVQKPVTVKFGNKNKAEKVTENLVAKDVENKIDTVQKTKPDVSMQGYCPTKMETKPDLVQDPDVFKKEMKPETARERSDFQGNVDKLDIFEQTAKSTRSSKPDYAKLAGIKRRSPSSVLSSPELPRFVRNARRRGKRTRQEADQNRRTDACKQFVVEVTEKHDDTECRSPPKQCHETREQVVTRNQKKQTAIEKLSARHYRKIVRNPFLERDSQQKVRKRLLKIGSLQKSEKSGEVIVVEPNKTNETDGVDSTNADVTGEAETPKTNRTSVDDIPTASDISLICVEDDTSSEFQYHVHEVQTSPEFLKFSSFRNESRSRPEPDPDVYNWPKEWLPNPDTPLVPANTSALEIDPPVTKPPYHVFENTFYLKSPPKMRSEMERWKFNFDYNPQVEKARLKKIKETEQQLLAETMSGPRRTKTEKLAIKKQAKIMVDTEEFLEKLARYNERKMQDMETMGGVYQERNLGEPLDSDDIAEMAMDIKHKVFLQSMRIANPEHIFVRDEETDNGEANFDFTTPNTDTITDKARNIANQALQQSEAELEKELGVVIHEAEIRPSAGVNYVYESYKMERNMALDHSYSNNNALNVNDKPRDISSDQPQRKTLWYGHEKHRKLEQYKRRKYAGQTPSCTRTSSSSLYKSRFDDESIDVNESFVSDDQLNINNEVALVMPNYDETEKCNDGTGEEEEEEEEEEEGEELEDITSQSRMTLWHGHGQSSSDDEDEAVKMMCAGNEKRKFDAAFDDKETMKVDFYNPWYGHDDPIQDQNDLLYTEEYESAGRSIKRTHDETDGNDEMIDENDEDQTYTRAVPFLQLTTEDLPLRVLTQTYKFQRASCDIYKQDTFIDH